MFINNSHSMGDLSSHNASQVITDIDPIRPPQLNPENISNSCACKCVRRTIETATSLPDNTAIDLDDDDITSSASSDYGDLTIEGNEGVEDHLIEVGDFGYIPIKAIQQALARHHRCTCHHGIGILPEVDDYPFTALPSRTESPGLTPGASMSVEVGSEDQSLTSSMLSLQSRNSSVFAFAGGWVSHDSLAPTMGVYILTPLRLTPDLAYPLELAISDEEKSGD